MTTETEQQKVDQINAAITEAATTGVQSTTVDGVSVTRMSVTDMIKARNDQKRQAIKNPLDCLRIFRVDKPIRN